MKKFTILIAIMLLSGIAMRGQDCTALEGSYNLDFESVTAPALPDCTVNINVGTGNNWTTVDNPGNGFENKALQYTATTAPADTWFFMRGVNLTAGVAYRVTYKYGNNGTGTETFQTTYGLAPNAASATLLSLAHTFSDGVVHNGSFSYFTVPTTGTYYFGFHALSAANQGNIYIDDFKIEPTTCGTLSNLVVSGLTQTGVTLTWNPATGGNVTSLGFYYYALSTTNTPPATGTAVFANTLTSTTLLPGTTYYMFVKSACAGNVSGDWLTTSFTTPGCEASAIPYTIDFESATTPALPECTSVTPITTGSQWATAPAPGNGFNNNTLQYAGTTTTANAWFFTKGVQLTAGTFYKISYKYGNNSADTTEALKFAVATSPNEASVTNVLNNHASITGGTATNFTSESAFSVPTSGIYYFGFNAYSALGQGNIYVDDLVIEDWVCSEPANIGFSNLTTTAATISWTAQGNPAVGYLYACKTTNTAPVAAEETFTPGTTVSLTTLLPGTTYYFFIKGICGPVMGTYNEAFTFTTPSCEPATVPYSQDFELATVPGLPACTSVAPVTTGSQWATVAAPGNGFTTAALQYTGTTTAADAWFFTQGIQLTAGAFYKVTYKIGNNGATTTEGLTVKLATSPNPASTDDASIAVHPAITGGTSLDFTSGIIAVPATGVYYIGFNANSAAAQGNLYIDNIEVKLWDCGIAQNVSISNITTTGATVTWAAPVENTSIGYFVALSTTNEAPAGGPYVSGLTTDLTALEPGTTYYVFVKSQCGPLTGDWAESVSITTPACAATTVPYTQDFETTFVPAIPACSTTVPAVTGNNWVTVNNPGSGFTSNTLHYAANNEAADAWFFTQGIQLTAGTLYKISYSYGNNSAGTTENLKVAMASNPNPAFLIGEAPIAEHVITGGTLATNQIDYFNVAVSGVYYFGFNAHSASGQGSLYVDNIAIEESVCGVTSNVTVTGITTATATVTWEVPTTGNSPVNVYQYYVGTTNTPPTAGEFIPALTVNLDELLPDTTYYVFTRSSCGPIWSDWTITEFTTQEEPTSGIGDVTFKGFAAYPNPATHSLKIDNSANIDSVELFNVTGQLVLRQAVNGTNAEINLENLASGAYLLSVHADEATKRVKIIKQ